MVEESPYIAQSISRIPLPPGMCQVVCGSPGGWEFVIVEVWGKQTSLPLFPALSLRNKQRRR